MKVISVPLLLGLTAICAQCAVLRLPEPPQQHRPWHPDPATPTNILSAAETLFEQGFPDPRGCEYHEIEVEVSGVWDGKARLVETRGWVLPKRSGTDQFAICWNGLIYPVAKVSTPADLHAEVANSNLPRSRRFGFSGGSAIGETGSVSYTNALSTRVLLLLHCGETAAALTNWPPNQRMMVFGGGFGGGRGQVQSNDPYLEFAGDWAWAMFDRTLSAHQRGDEALALATAQQLAGVQLKIEAECARRGFQPPQHPTPGWGSKPGPYLDFLDQLPQILAELERVAKEPAKTSIIEAGLTHYPDQTKRIAALVDDLDLVSARQWSQPGRVNLPDDPIVSALIQEGDPAVEPLLNCLENDKRLTRSVGFGRDFFRGRRVIPVHDAAKAALLSILRAGFNDDAPEIRAYWDKYKDLKLEDRWYAMLDDDSANARWGEAAANIVQPENVRRFSGGLSISNPAPTNVPVRMDGETLRAKTNPSVAELLARRALEVPANNIKAYDLSASCQMALYLAAWDSAASLPVARTLSGRACSVMKYSGQQLGPLVTKLALARAKAGDPQAFDDYTSWIATTAPDSLGFSLSECLEPFRQFATNRILQAAAEKMFGETNSDWSQLPWKEMHGDNPIGSDLVKVPAFRWMLIRELGKTNICGHFAWRAPGQIDYAITNYQSGSYGAVAFPSGPGPANGTTSELRWCDWVAFSLSQAKHIPFFDPFAPVVERDAAIENARKLLGQQ
jgi:hypothetical protein